VRDIGKCGNGAQEERPIAKDQLIARALYLGFVRRRVSLGVNFMTGADSLRSNADLICKTVKNDQPFELTNG